MLQEVNERIHITQSTSNDWLIYEEELIINIGISLRSLL